MTPRIIKNFDTLATNPQREDALTILEVGLGAIKTGMIMEENIRLDKDTLIIKNNKIDLKSTGKIIFIGIGKCAFEAGEAIEKILGDKISQGIILDVRGGILKKMKSEIGTHPFPSEKNIEVTKSILDMVKDLTEKDLVIFVISGGGSSLFCYPNDITCNDLQKITKAMMKKGLSISEMNIVRKHTSKIKGGQFAKMLYPANVYSLIFSDVPGDDLSVIASGPTIKDTSTIEDAAKILAKHGILKTCGMDNCGLIETPKEDKYFEKVKNILLLTNETALSAMKEEAEILGYKTSIVETQLSGEAKVFGEKLAEKILGPKCCEIYGGELTVSVKGDGKGGRCQEMLLAGLNKIRQGEVLVACSSDGMDNTDVAGAIIDSDFLKKANSRDLSIEKSLKDNDSYTFMKNIGAQIVTGKTGSNVSDLYLKLSK